MPCFAGRGAEAAVEAGLHVQVEIDAQEAQGDGRIKNILKPVFEALSQKLSGEYGGPMEQLWIDFEILPADAEQRGPWSFRFQKRVAPPRWMVDAFGTKPEFNVGHYSLRVDYAAFRELDHYLVFEEHDPKEIIAYAVRLLYESTQTLRGKKRTLGAFDADAFRARFIQALGELGIAIDQTGSG